MTDFDEEVGTICWSPQFQYTNNFLLESKNISIKNRIIFIGLFIVHKISVAIKLSQGQTFNFCTHIIYNRQWESDPALWSSKNWVENDV